MQIKIFTSNISRKLAARARKLTGTFPKMAHTPKREKLFEIIQINRLGRY